MKKLQTLTTSTAIALASVSAPAFAQEAQATPVPAETAVNEPTLVAKSQLKPLEKSQVPAPSTVKPALDAQKAVVKEAEAKIDTAKAGVKEKEATVASIETEYSNADKAVNDAQAIASQVTPEKVAEVKDAQAKNLEAQTANQKATEATNEQIKTETTVLAEKQSDVASAQANLEQANKDVQTAEQTVANAESALDGTGLATAEKDLKEAQKGVKDTEATVTEAETAFATAKKADEAREDAIKSAETDVNTKNDAVKLAKEKLTTANQHAESVEAKLQSAQDELKKAQDALKNIGKPTNIYEAINAEIVDKSGTIYFKDKTFDLTAKMNEFRRLIKEDKNVEAQKYAEENLLSSMLNLYIDDTSQQFIKALIGDEAFNKTYNLQNGKLILSREDYKALNIAFASQLNAFRKISGLEPINKVTENSIDLGMKAIDAWNDFANKPENVNKYGSELGHNGFSNVQKATGAFTENIYPMAGFKKSSMTFTELNTLFVYHMLGFAFKDAHSNWGHYFNLLSGDNVHMGLYQNRSDSTEAGGAYFTHSFPNAKANDTIIYSQYGAIKLSKIEHSLAEYNSKVAELINYAVNHPQYIYLLQEYNNYYAAIQNEYRRTNVIDPQKQAQLDGKAKELDDYEKEHKVPSIDFTGSSGGFTVRETFKLRHIAPFNGWSVSWLKKNDDGTFKYQSSSTDDFSGTLDDYKKIMTIKVDNLVKSKLSSMQEQIAETKQLYAPFFEKLSQAEIKNNVNQLQAKVIKSQSNLEQATTALENAKNALTKASTDYASALSLKTEAEKVLASAMATPLQAQVAENNLRLANIALENAKKREAKASEAVANFSASLADKKATLEKAQDALKSAKTVKTIASQALDIASANLEDQETKLDNLNKQVTKLLAEKDALVKEAKELAEQLQAYLDAPVALTKAKQARTAVSVKLELAKADLEMAQSKLENLLTAQKAEEAKLAELEATYARLVDLAEKAQENVVATLSDGTIVAIPKDAPVAETLPELNLEELAKEDAKDSTVKTLPDGTIVAVPKDAPVAEELPTINVDELKKALDAGKEVTLDAQGNVVVRETKPATYEKPVNVDRPQVNNDKSNKDYASDKNVTIDNKGNVIVKGQTYTSQQQASSKSTYSRVERAKTLPNTGTKESNLTLFVLAILSGLGIALKRRQGK
ncbi:LPXTG cell wall anchor domain-containing protein [Streptococcus sp. 27098_8_22]|uniref:LPXTG cell wall anchor domain-containing protein n=1 Tax=Streptococcus sp. 27098_8_22 TaxID=3003665 RepID=UPI00352CE0D7